MTNVQADGVGPSAVVSLSGLQAGGMRPCGALCNGQLVESKAGGTRPCCLCLWRVRLLHPSRRIHIIAAGIKSTVVSSMHVTARLTTALCPWALCWYHSCYLEKGAWGLWAIAGRLQKGAGSHSTFAVPYICCRINRVDSSLITLGPSSMAVQEDASQRTSAA